MNWISFSGPPSVARIALRCSSLMTSSATVTDVTPSTASTARVTRPVISSRIGHPATVR